MIIIINFKTYPQATGAKAVALAQLCEAFATERQLDIRVAVQASDIYRVSQAVSIPVYAQHIDAISPGRDTGFLLPEAIKEAGATGTLINHSEHQLDDEGIAQRVARAQEVGLKVIICADTPERATAFETYTPEFIAVEPPEMIAKVSITTKPEIIEKARSLIKNPLLVGAGVTSGKDVAKAIELKTEGVLLASAICKADDPKAALERLLDF
jgi:triosephosphate isomerase